MASKITRFVCTMVASGPPLMTFLLICDSSLRCQWCVRAAYLRPRCYAQRLGMAIDSCEKGTAGQP